MAQRGLLIALFLQLGILAAEAVGGWYSQSLSLLSDAGHVLTDVLALALALWAARLAGRPAGGRHTFGYRRAEILAALVNGLSLVVVALFVVKEAYHRYQEPSTIKVGVMLVVAVIGLVGNIAGVAWLVGVRRSANVRAALLHLLGDALSSVGVVVGGVLILLTGLTVIDVLVSVMVAAIILLGAVNLLRDVVEILLETAPPGLLPDPIIAAMREVQGVQQVHEFHLWRITHDALALSAHVHVDPNVDRDLILAELQALLVRRFELRHSTLQLEVDRPIQISLRAR